MKIKNKKIILMTIMSTMGVGLLTLSIGHIEPQAKEEPDTQVVNIYQTDEKLSNDDASNIYIPEVEKGDDSATPTIATTISPTPTPAPTPSPTPAPLPVYDLEENKNTKIEELFGDYYVAKYSCDIDQIKKLLSSPSDAPTADELKKETQYIDDIRNIKCYTKKSYEKNAYIVYVYCEIKFINIKTPTPHLDLFYLVTDKKGSLKIYSSDYSKELSEYLSARKEDADVQKLIKETVKKISEAKAKDSGLRKYLDKLSQ